MAEPGSGTAAHPGDWPAVYAEARRREGRLLSDEAVALLPEVPRSHPHSSEWSQRADSAERLVTYLRSHTRSPSVVDLGCGNGWLANRIAAVDGSLVVGVDATAVELDQACRVFGGRPNLRFVAGDLLDGQLPIDEADVVVMASVLQYVPDPAALLARLLSTLAPQGELHVLDTPIYKTADLPGARERSRQHYASIGVPEMASVYHHHDWAALRPLSYDVLYRPDDVVHRVERRLLRRPRSPFPWLRFREASP
jgi:SAM-dependent methyltransferase